MSDVLVLNADGQPVSYLPLSAIQWKDAITYLWMDKVTVLDWYDDWVVSSPSWETKVPAVIMMKQMMRRRTNPRFGKTNLYIRDLFTCQYCDNRFSKVNLTLDHVLPISKGGSNKPKNLRIVKRKTNRRKKDKMPVKRKRTKRTKK